MVSLGINSIELFIPVDPEAGFDVEVDGVRPLSPLPTIEQQWSCFAYDPSIPANILFVFIIMRGNRLFLMIMPMDCIFFENICKPDL